ncbi:MAG: Short-chain dehydrogenase, partial [uncultured Arthrobacter sp.]
DRTPRRPRHGRLPRHWPRHRRRTRPHPPPPAGRARLPRPDGTGRRPSLRRDLRRGSSASSGGGAGLRGHRAARPARALGRRPAGGRHRGPLRRRVAGELRGQPLRRGRPDPAASAGPARIARPGHCHQFRLRLLLGGRIGCLQRHQVRPARLHRRPPRGGAPARGAGQFDPPGPGGHRHAGRTAPVRGQGVLARGLDPAGPGGQGRAARRRCLPGGDHRDAEHPSIRDGL